MGGHPRARSGRLRTAGQAPSLACAAAVAAGACAFVAGVKAITLIRPGLLADPEPSWAPYRLVLMLAVAGPVRPASATPGAPVSDDFCCTVSAMP